MSDKDFVGIDAGKAAKDIARISKHLEHLPPALQDAIVDAVTPVILREMKLYDRKKSVKRVTAYGVTFFSDRQRRYFFGYILPKGIPYNRTMGMKNAWRVIGTGKTALIVNETDAALYTMDDKRQSRHETLVGWRTVSQRLQFARDGTRKAAVDAAKKVCLEFDHAGDPRNALR